MQPFTTHTGIAVPLLADDINTDQIAPVQAMRQFKPDYKALLFMRARRRDDGSEDPDFVLNRPQFRNAGILVTGHNFGAGSSREAAVWGMLANNIRVIVARSFADIYRENCLQNGLLPIVLESQQAEAFTQRVLAVNGQAPFTVDLQIAAHQRPRRSRHRLRHPDRRPHAPDRRPRRYRAHAQACGRDRGLGAAHGRRRTMVTDGGGQPGVMAVPALGATTWTCAKNSGRSWRGNTWC